VLTQFINT